MINLCLVVIATQFSETKKREMARMKMERARFQSNSTLESSTNNSEPKSCYAAILKYIGHLFRQNKRKILKKFKLIRYRRMEKLQNDTLFLTRIYKQKKHHVLCPKLAQQQNSCTLSINNEKNLNSDTTIFQKISIQSNFETKVTFWTNKILTFQNLFNFVHYFNYNYLYLF